MTNEIETIICKYVKSGAIDMISINAEQLAAEIRHNISFELDAMQGRDKWLPISSAPKDGTWVLLLNSQQFAIQARWLERPNTFPAWVSTGKGKTITKATHWLELPKPPTGDK